MVKKNTPQSPPEASAPQEDPRTPFQQTLGAASGMLILVGGLALVMDIMGGGDTATWLRYAGIAVLLGGIGCWYFSGMPRQQSLEWVKSGVFALSLALLIRWPIAEPYRIPSGSMEPTLHGDPAMGKGDRVFVNKFVYGVRYPFMNKRIWHGKAPERWDMVVFKSVEPNAEHPTLVKRIVGMPGEQIQIREGKIWINGDALELPDFMPEVYYTAPRGALSDMRYGILPDPEYSQIPEGHYLVLGDNSAHSRDGRVFGWLPNEHIVGRVASIWWPPPRWRDFTGFTSSLWWNGLLGLIVLGLLGRMFIGRSWAVLSADGERVLHLAVAFIPLGLRIPFTRTWLMRWGSVRRHDRVLYRIDHPDLPADAFLVGRIAGLPGEQVSLTGENLLVNDGVIDAPWMAGQDYGSANLGPYGRKKSKSQVPDDHYFVLAEQAAGEAVLDSRAGGWVPATAIGGKVVGQWWPLSGSGQ